MYVCQCEVVTDLEVERAVEAGAGTVAEVGDHTGAGTNCGTCHESIEAILDRCAGCPRLVLVAAS